MTARTAKSQKAKGRTFQQQIRGDLIARFCISPIDIKSTDMGQAGCDIYLAQAAREIFPFGIECKNTERLEIWSAAEQCETNAAKEGLRPLLIFRRNRTEPRAVLPWHEFCAIWIELLTLRKRVGAQPDARAAEEWEELALKLGGILKSAEKDNTDEWWDYVQNEVLPEAEAKIAELQRRKEKGR